MGLSIGRTASPCVFAGRCRTFTGMARSLGRRWSDWGSVKLGGWAFGGKRRWSDGAFAWEVSEPICFRLPVHSVHRHGTSVLAKVE
jgi:hypothetical protein